MCIGKMLTQIVLEEMLLNPPLFSLWIQTHTPPPHTLSLFHTLSHTSQFTKWVKKTEYMFELKLKIWTEKMLKKFFLSKLLFTSLSLSLSLSHTHTHIFCKFKIAPKFFCSFHEMPNCLWILIWKKDSLDYTSCMNSSGI